MSEPTDFTAEGAEFAEERNRDCLHESFEITPEVRAELERRVALADADPDRGVPWETVRVVARARHKKE